MDNGMESMLDTYLYETTSLLDQLDEMLVTDEKNGGISSDGVNEIFRIMHTIKGSSAMMEYGSLTTIAHRMEDLFSYIRESGIDSLDPAHKKELFNLMFRSEDYLRSEISKVERSVPLSTDMESFSQEITDFLTCISSEDPPDHREADCCLHVYLDEGVGMENLRAFMIVNALKECDLAFRSCPHDMDTNPDTCSYIAENGFYLTFDSEDGASAAIEILQTQNYIRSYELIKEPIPVDAQDETAPAAVRQAAAACEAVTPSPVPIKQNLISVNLMKLDSLMALVGEIVITESMVTSSPELQHLNRDSFDNFMKSARQLRKLTDDLQDIAMSLRMVPISGVFQKMNRIVRDMTQKLDKDVRLTVSGENTEVDKTIVDSIQDPIMHLVRNSMDHGIEDTVQERLDAGKHPQGEIILSASHTSSEVLVSIADDGRGMDPAKLLLQAKEKGLLTKPESEYTRKEALSLIMLPGFSTNDAVTEFSGRGVGMDVVKKNVESIGGTISLSSEDGAGTTVTMKIPLTLAIVDGMKVTVGDSIFTIPISNIRQSFKMKSHEMIHDEYGNEMVERMGSFYPMIRLHRFYCLDTRVTAVEDGILLWVEAGDRSYCLFVDDLIGEQQVVVKPLPAFLNRFALKDHGITGCTILGDGTISIILDILSLYTAAIESL